MTRQDDLALVKMFMRKFECNPTWSIPHASEFLSDNGITKRKGPSEWRGSEAHLTTEEIAAVLGVRRDRAGELLSKSGVPKSQREGYHMEALAEAVLRMKNIIEETAHSAPG